jgi:fibronectin type 3 domain-containing protein
MKLEFITLRGLRDRSSLLATLAILGLVPVSGASAQAPPVPSTFQAIYSSLNTYLVNFNTTLVAQPTSQTSLLNTGNLKNADANAGPPLINPGTMTGIQLQLQELKAMGMQAIMVEVGFPMLYEPFLASQGQSYTQWVTFYQQIAAMVRAAGLKLIVENDTLLVTDMQANWNAGPFFASLSWTQYEQARAQTALTVAQTMQPNYLVVIEEPATEVVNSGQSEVNTPTGSASLLSQILATLQDAGVPGMQVGAGTSTSQQNALEFIQQYVALPVNFIDFHMYPINDDFLPIALQIVSTAAAAGKPVAMSECWLWKVADSELSVLNPDQVRARDPFSFWAPLDALFIQTMQNLGKHSQMLFMNPFNTEIYASYLPYDSATQNLTPPAITSMASAQASTNEGLAMYTSTATGFYASSIPQPDKIPPSVPPGVTGVSGNPTTATLNWNSSADNVGVAGYYVSRNGAVVATTASQYYQDSGLTQSTTYNYTLAAFDLGGNISPPSPSVSVTTADVTPPATPGGVVATANSSVKVTLSWSPSTDNVAIGSYIVFAGLSPAALTQVGRTSATGTTYPSSPLTPGSTNYYGVEAVDTSGNISAMSAVVSATTPKPPAAPAGLVATAASTTRIGVTWSAAASGGLPIQNYHVYRGTSPSSLSQVAIVLQTAYTDTAVAEGATYYYAVQAADSGADLSLMSLTVSATPLALPSAPTALSATAPSKAEVTLTWSAGPSGMPLSSFSVFRGTTPSNLTSIKLVASSQTSMNDYTVTAGATYYYAVQETDTGGNVSPMSHTVSVVTP